MNAHGREDGKDGIFAMTRGEHTYRFQCVMRGCSTIISKRPDFWKVVQSAGHLFTVSTLWCWMCSGQIQADEEKWYLAFVHLKTACATNIEVMQNEGASRQ